MRSGHGVWNGLVGGIAVVVLVMLAPVALAERARCPAGMASVLGRYCIDRYEASVDVVTAQGRTLRRHSPYQVALPGVHLRARSRKGVVPQAHFSQLEAQAACAAAGKRLCSDEEWLAACRGPERTRYPYGSERRDGYCNDHGVSPLRVLHGADESLDTFSMDAMNDPRLNQVPGSVARTGQFGRCRNGLGVYDMVGNLHEWTSDPRGTFRGGYYLDTSINGEGCAYATKAHSAEYHDYSVGFRCCRDLGLGDPAREDRRSGRKAGRGVAGRGMARRRLASRRRYCRNSSGLRAD
jgi:formylglycine-generating enzyme